MAKRPWWERAASKDERARRAADEGGRAYGGPNDYLGTEAARNYLLGNLRVNAPGFDSQSPLALSQAFTGATYLAVSSFAAQAGQAEVKLFEHDPDDPDSKEPLSHLEDAAQLVHNPNPDDTFGEILEQTALQYKLTGTACLWVPHDVEDEHDLPRETYVLSTASLLPQPIGPDYPNGAYLVQPWYPAGPYATLPQSRGLGAIVPAEQIVRVKEPHPFFRWIGYATLTGIAAQTDTARMIDLCRSNHMARGFDPSVVFTVDPNVQRPDDAALRRFEAQLMAIHQGPQNAGRMFVAPAGLEATVFGHTPDTMAYESGWQSLLEFGLAAFKTNSAVAGMTKDLSYATLYASLRAFYVFGLRPFLSKVAAKWTRHVFHPFFGRSLLMELEGQSVVDEELRNKELELLARHGAIKVGEMRKKLGYEPSDRDGEWVGADKGQGGPGAPGAGGGGEDNPLASLMAGLGDEDESPDEREMNRKRPRNEAGRGSLGERMPGSRPGLGGGPARKSLTTKDREDRLGAVLERHLANGSIKPHKG